MKTVLFVFGTRPEAIKMAPLIGEFRKFPDLFSVRVCVTAQHRDMLDQVLSFFGIRPDHDLNLMRPSQTLTEITSRVLSGIEKILNESPADLVLVQGDTTTAFAGALAAYYARVRIGHVEAGLRSHDKYSPFPEEINRSLIGRLADDHFAPTPTAARNLESEGVRKGVHVVGNTVIDALLLGREKIRENGNGEFEKKYRFLDSVRRLILVTGHRRESFGEPFENICGALRDIAGQKPDVQIVYPVHLNPNVREPVNRILKGLPNVHLIEPVPYPDLIWLLDRSLLVLTDSGGIQEEAPSLGKPVLVMRDVTERTEGIEAGTARLVGTGRERIVSDTLLLLDNASEYEAMAKAVNPYGDGQTSRKIVDVYKNQ